MCQIYGQQYEPKPFLQGFTGFDMPLQQQIEVKQEEKPAVKPADKDDSQLRKSPKMKSETKNSEEQAIACVVCKLAHRACDGQRPCGRCIRLDVCDRCRDPEKKKRGRRKKIVKEIMTLADQCKHYGIDISDINTSEETRATADALIARLKNFEAANANLFQQPPKQNMFSPDEGFMSSSPMDSFHVASPLDSLLDERSMLSAQTSPMGEMELPLLEELESFFKTETGPAAMNEKVHISHAALEESAMDVILDTNSQSGRNVAGIAGSIKLQQASSPAGAQISTLWSATL
eukprot:Clim_evm56s136 gene=Clim_evmTU56s136